MVTFKRYTTVLLFCLIICFGFFGCGKKADSYVTDVSDTALSVGAKEAATDIFVAEKNKKKLSLIATSDMTELYFHKKTHTVSVYDEGSGELWSSLTEDYIEAQACALSVKVLVDGNEYELNSQGDSLSPGNASFEKSENGITVFYSFEKTLEDGRRISLNIPVSYTARNGALSVEVDCEKIIGDEHDEGIAVTQISVLPFFGACEQADDGDFMLLPDGCGLTVDISENPDKFKAVSLDVYGNDEKVLLGCFGMKKGNGAFVALVEQGDAIAQINATKALSTGGCNSVYASFNLTETEKKDGKLYVASKSYDGKISLVYRFLSSDSASYIGMAGAVREMLIRNGTLLSDTSEKSGQFPFNLSLVLQNYVTTAKEKTLAQTFTTFEQATEILSSMKAKGFSLINVELEGLFTGENILDAEINFASGSRSDLSALINYGKNTGITFYATADILTSAADNAFSSLATTLSGESLSSENLVYASVGSLKSNVNSLLSYVKDSDLNISVGDGGGILYSDYTENKVYLRSDTAKEISQQISAISAHKKLMVDSGNIYTVKYADMIIDLPMSASLQSRDLCSRVPFIQAVLHGIVDYSHSPVNLISNSERAFLKAVEYGAVLHYQWHANELLSSDTASSYYSDSLNTAQIQQERLEKAFSDLRQARITDHYLVKKGVYYTEYDSSTGIYVNYNDTDVRVNGVTVEAMSFLRVN